MALKYTRWLYSHGDKHTVEQLMDAGGRFAAGQRAGRLRPPGDDLVFPAAMPEGRGVSRPGATYFCRQAKAAPLAAGEDASAPHFLFRKENGPRPVQKKTFDRSGQT